jgi:hypothetical protein
LLTPRSREASTPWLARAAGPHHKEQARWASSVVVEPVVSHDGIRRLTLVAPGPQIDGKLGVGGGRDLQTDAVPRKEALRCIPHHDIDLLHRVWVHGLRLLMARAVAQPHDTVAQSLREPAPG